MSVPVHTMPRMYAERLDTEDSGWKYWKAALAANLSEPDRIGDLENDS